MPDVAGEFLPRASFALPGKHKIRTETFERLPTEHVAIGDLTFRDEPRLYGRVIGHIHRPGADLTIRFEDSPATAVTVKSSGCFAGPAGELEGHGRRMMSLEAKCEQDNSVGFGRLAVLIGVNDE